MEDRTGPEREREEGREVKREWWRGQKGGGGQDPTGGERK